MNKQTYFLYSLLFTILITSCKTRTGETQEDTLPYSPYVEAFTSGKVSRHSPVYLIFEQELPAEKLNTENLKKLIRIKPDVKGDFSFENSRTVVFKPADGFQRNTTYRMTADLSGWFDIQSKDKVFAWDFTTYPAALRADLESIDISEDTPGSFDITFTLMTPDREEAQDIEPILGISEDHPKIWQHSTDGRKHQVTLKNVPGGKGSARDLSLTVKSNKLGIPSENLITIQIPDVSKFSVYEVELVNDEERYIEVTFTQPLDPIQDMHGLAWLSNTETDSSSELVDVEGNKMRLYPDAQMRGEVTVHLSKEIKSSSGVTLDERVTRTVTISDNKPAVEFIGNGVITPQTTELIIPFKAVYLRGVVARVIRISEQNIGQFLQTNALNGSNELIRTGRLVARKTIFLDEDSKDLSQWRNYALDLKQLMDPEPGAIYRVELSFNKDLSVYPCGDEEQISKEEILAQDELKFKEELAKYDEGGYHYFWWEYYWWDYNYEERDNPCSTSYYRNKNIGKNILATNLGLIAKRGQNNELTVLVHNIETTYPEKGVEITAYTYQNGIVGKGTTDESGKTTFSLSSGKPFYIIAAKGNQRSYLRIDDGSALSLSTFDVAGEAVSKGIKGFIYGDRGVWRPGDTLHLSFMLNDRDKKLPPNHPVIMELFTPLGQSYLKRTQSFNELGLYTFAMPTDPDAQTGAWNVTASVGGVTFSKRLRIETIKPNRLKINFNPPEKGLQKGETYEVPIHVEWLHGGIAKNMKYEIQGTFMSTLTKFDNYPNFVFDDPTKKFDTEESSLISGKTDDKGDATIKLRFESGSSAPGMLTTNLVTRVFEESGDFSVDGVNTQYSPYRRYVGIRSPQRTKKQLDTGKPHEFDVAVVDHTGKAMPDAEVRVKVYKVYWYFWWESNYSGGLANYISNRDLSPTKELTVKTGANGQGKFSLQFDRNQWGTYYISVQDKDGNHSAGLSGYFDWPEMEGRRESEGSNSADVVSITTDKKEYVSGEKMIVTVPSAEAGRAIISIENGTKVVSVTEHYCKEGETQIPIEATEDMQPNVYIHVSVLQPHAYTENDLPIRRYGVVPVTVTSPKSHLRPVIKTADEYKPESPYEITVSEEDGREMAYTLAIVDEGLLDLTRFPTPNAWQTFNAREALGVTTWDHYNYIIGAFGGRLEQIFSIGGDDELGKSPKAIVNRFKPVVQFEGPFLLKKGEKKRHRYTMPNYNGRVRVMVVAGDGEAYGSTEKSVMVRKPVMLLGTLPRVIGVGEEMAIPATVFATEKGVGKVKVTISCSDNMQIIGSDTQELQFSDPEDKQAMFRIKVKNTPGAGRVTLTASGKGDKCVYETDIEIRSVRRPQVKVIPVTLEAGKSWKETVTLPGATGTNKLSLEVSDIPPINLASRLSYLIGYPHGCIEQITSKGFPQLYLKQFADLTREQELTTENAVKEVISRMRSYQTAEGSFAYWPGGSSVNGWATTYATHFLLEAERRGFHVPSGLKQQALNHLRKVSRNWRPVENHYTRSEEMIQAYRLYVLAMGQMSEMGAMNRLKENEKLTQTSRWLLASSYALVGRTDVSTTLISKTVDISDEYNYYDLTYGSNLRDKAIYLQTLCLLNKGADAAVLVKDIAASLSTNNWYSTQTTAFTLVALSQYINRYNTDDKLRFSYKSDNKTENINTDKNIWSETLFEKGAASAPLEVINTSQGTIFVRVISEGIPEQGDEEAYSNGVELTVKYADASGKTIEVDKMEQGVNFTALVTIKNPSPTPKRNLVLTQIFPAGWEILNTRFLNEASSDTSAGLSYQDIRDDRVYSYVDLLDGGRQVTVRINLSTVYPGKFYLPPVYCEAMYDHLIRANTEGIMMEIH